MSDWQIGDLALCVPGASCGTCYEDGEHALAGQSLRVIGVVPSPLQPILLFSISERRDWCACQFRKIRPDEQEACEPEFITLLKRSKVPETASDWLIRVGPLAKQLNEQSKFDESPRESVLPNKRADTNQ